MVHCVEWMNLNSCNPKLFYGPFSGTTQVSRCQKRTSALMMQGKINRGRHTEPSGWAPLLPY